MTIQFRSTLATGLAVALVALWSPQGAALAADDKAIDDLRERIESLEKQNQELLRLVKSQGSVHGKPADLPSASGSIQPAADTPAGDAKKPDDSKKPPAPPAEFEVGKDLKMSASWNHGVQFESADKAFKIHVGGRTQIDAVFMDAPQDVQFGAGGVGKVDDGVGFRRARFKIDGTFWEVIDFEAEYDFMNTFNAAEAGEARNIADTPVPTDLWVQITHLPVVGNFRIGNQKPNISFEHLTSSRYLNFLERSYSFDAFIGGLNNGFFPGLQFFNNAYDERMFWALGVFKNNNTIFGWNTGDGEYDVTGRVTALPIYENEGRCLVHVGFGASHRDADDGTVRVRARTEVRNGPAALHTTMLNATMLSSGQTVLVPELVAVWGPWSMQSEYFATWAHDTIFPATPAAAQVPRGTAFFQGFYIEGHYFLTGEHRRYNKKAAAFDRVIPNENFFLVKGEDGRRISGKGAWQAAARYTYIDLEEKGIAGGVAHDVTVGLNWFLNPNLKIQWNYSYGVRNVPGDTSDGYVQGFGTRMALDF